MTGPEVTRDEAEHALRTGFDNTFSRRLCQTVVALYEELAGTELALSWSQAAHETAFYENAARRACLDRLAKGWRNSRKGVKSNTHWHKFLYGGTGRWISEPMTPEEQAVMQHD